MTGMKTLYVSDLDGTLFNKKKKISPYSADVINQCIKKGMDFTIATARMPYGCDYRLKDIQMKTPGILTNGVFIYEFSKQEFCFTETIETVAAKTGVQVIRDAGLSCFVYLFKAGTISIYYNDKSLEEQTQYYSDRALAACGEVCLTDDLDGIWSKGEPVYLALTGTEEKLKPVCEKLDRVSGISYVCYLNIYNGLYCLELFSEHASKQNALKRLKEDGGYDELVVFGDNLNDLSMIEIADRSYAPFNALEVVKERVTGVLDDCSRDGVAKFLAKEWNL